MKKPKTRVFGKCQLCLQEKELQPNSHIIPDFFYRESELFHPNNHNLVTIGLNSLKNGLVKIIYNKQKTGYFDQNILCFDCDQRILGVYETYGRSFFYSKSIPIHNRLIINDCTEYTECLNSDYQKIKLLFLSILWRTGISKQQMFDHVRLEQEPQEAIRRMVLEGNPKTDTDFPIVFLCSLTDNSITRDHLFQPIRIKSKVNGSYSFFFCFVYNGFHYFQGAYLLRYSSRSKLVLKVSLWVSFHLPFTIAAWIFQQIDI